MIFITWIDSIKQYYRFLVFFHFYRVLTVGRKIKNFMIIFQIIILTIQIYINYLSIISYISNNINNFFAFNYRFAIILSQNMFYKNFGIHLHGYTLNQPIQ